MKYIYGPIPSRRLGSSLGISPLPLKTCNYSCVYCQLGRTKNLTTKRSAFVSVEEIISEFLKIETVTYDVVTICGDGEPTLYLYLGKLIERLRQITSKPIVVITNGSLLNSKDVRADLQKADIIMPTLNGYDEESFQKLSRNYHLRFENTYQGLIAFSSEFCGEIWLEIMFVRGINDHQEALKKYQNLLQKIKYHRLYLNIPIRPPAEKDVFPPEEKFLFAAAAYLNGIPALGYNASFQSEDQDDYEAIINIIKRHPMNNFEIKSFLKSRNCQEVENIFRRLNRDKFIDVINYKGIYSYRYRLEE